MVKREAAQETRRHSELKSNLNLILYVLFITALSSLIALIVINYNLGKAISTTDSEKREVDLTGEATGGRQCMDKKDNDKDGLIDYPADPGCSSPLDTSELDDSCSDTDGGIVPTEKGTVTGAISGYFYTYVDNCYVTNTT